MQFLSFRSPNQGAFLGLILILLWLVPVPAAAQEDIRFDLDTLSIAVGETIHQFDVELAATRKQRARGLMYRRQMDANAGMLFDYRRPKPVSMWMKNTFIPLDMLFIRADGTIESIRERTVPHSLSNIASKGKVRAVLELNAGTVSRLSIKPGDLVQHRIFGTAD